jgi:hypothetical protein
LVLPGVWRAGVPIMRICGKSRVEIDASVVVWLTGSHAEVDIMVRKGTSLMNSSVRHMALFMLAVLTITGLASAEPVAFNDPNLEAAICETLHVEPPVDSEFLGGLTRLSAEKAGVTDLTGLRRAANLEKLYLRSNAITDISELAALKHLRILFLCDNEITDIEPLAGLTGLQLLRLSRNPLQGRITALTGLVRLTELHLDGCGLSTASLNHLALMTRLGWLSINDNRITGIQPISPLTSLQILNFCHNRVTDISPVASLTNLRILQFWNNEVTDITPAAGLPGLDELAFDYNKVADISALTALKGLDILGMYGNELNAAAWDEHLPVIRVNNPGVYLSIQQRPAVTATAVQPPASRKTYGLVIAILVLAISLLIIAHRRGGTTAS